MLLNAPLNLNQIKEDKKVMIDNEGFKTLYFKFEEGKGLPNHVHTGFVAIQVLSGLIDVGITNEEGVELKEGDFFPFDARIEHNIVARKESKVLITIEK